MFYEQGNVFGTFLGLKDRLLFFNKKPLRKKHKTTASVLPAEVESWRILIEEEDESVWCTDKYVYTEKCRR